MDYEIELRDKLVRLAVQADAVRRPVKVSFHHGQSDITINRRRRIDGDMRNAPNPQGLHHPDLWTLDLQASTAQDRCLVFIHACHPVIVVGYAFNSISAGFPGVCRRQLQDQYGSTVHCQFIQGMTGNARPRILADIDTGRFRTSTEHDFVVVGTQLARAVSASLQQPGQTLDLNLASVTGHFSPRRDQTSTRQIIQNLAARDDERSHKLADYWPRRLNHGPPLAGSVPWPVEVIRLTGQHWIVYLAGEAVAEWLCHLRRWLAPRHLIGWTYCQDGQGYLATDELLPEGGYEVIHAYYLFRHGPGPFKQGLNDMLRQLVLGLVAGIK